MKNKIVSMIIALSIIMGILIIPTIPQAEAITYSTTHFIDNFDGEATDTTPPANFTNDTTNPPTIVNVTDLQDHTTGTGNSLYLQDAGNGIIWHNLNLTHGYYTQWVYMPTNTDQANIIFKTSAGHGLVNIGIHIRLDDDGLIYHDTVAGPFVSTGVTYTATTWHNLTIDFDFKQQTYDLVWNGSVIADDVRFIFSTHEYLSVMYYIFSGAMYIDDITSAGSWNSTGTGLPGTIDENALFNDDMEDTSKWNATGTFTTAAGIGTVAWNNTLNATYRYPQRDWINYIKIKHEQTDKFYSSFIYEKSDGTDLINITFGYNFPASQMQNDTISITSGANNDTFQGITLTDWNEFAIHYDLKNQDVNIYRRAGLAQWHFLFGMQLNSDTKYSGDATKFERAEIKTAATATGSLKIDFYSQHWPNIISIGDSIFAGHNVYDPDVAVYAGNDPYNNSFHNYTNVYPGVRNNLIIGKSDGSETSAQILTAIPDDVWLNWPKICIVQSSNNDNGTYTLPQKENNTQDTIDKLRSSPGDIKVIISEAIVPNDSYGSYGDGSIATYYQNWNNNNLSNMVNATIADIFTKTALDNGTGYLNTTMDSDGIHLDANGHEAVGNYLQTLFNPISITITSPTAGQSVTQGNTLSFVHSNTGLVTNYSINWGDGQYTNSTNNNTKTHAYGSTGNYNITLTVWNGSHTASATVNIIVTPTPSDQLMINLNNTFAEYIPLIILMFLIGAALYLLFGKKRLSD